MAVTLDKPNRDLATECVALPAGMSRELAEHILATAEVATCVGIGREEHDVLADDMHDYDDRFCRECARVVGM